MKSLICGNILEKLPFQLRVKGTEIESLFSLLFLSIQLSSRESACNCKTFLDPQNSKVHIRPNAVIQAFCAITISFAVTRRAKMAWYLYQMVTRNMLRTHNRKQVLSERKNPFCDYTRLKRNAINISNNSDVSYVRTHF